MSLLQTCVRRSVLRRIGARRLESTFATPDSKYADKLRRRAEEHGTSVDELKATAKQRMAKDILKERQTLEALAKSNMKLETFPPSTSSVKPTQRERKDGSPIRPLDSILNLTKIMETPHSFAQISALWTAYHVSRSGGTGRGYICAAIPTDLYAKMTGIAQRYPSFIAPLPRIQQAADIAAAGTAPETAYEFHFLQWDFHGSPPIPSATEPDLFTPLASHSHASLNPQTSTVLFTPLQEYKIRQAFATPYLVLTHYTDLAHSHGVILMRGEITASSATAVAGDGRYMLSQEDAQLLALSVQKYYLWGQGSGNVKDREGERLLKLFHDSPDEFNWQDLLNHTKATSSIV